jgi:glutamine amidotransferase
MVRRSGGECETVNSPDAIINLKKIILPGVGAFDHGMQGLKQGGWIEFLNEAVLEKKIPVLGICLGMQLMCQKSEEGILPGLGWIDAEVKKFNLDAKLNLKIPHMGWNTINILDKPTGILENTEEEQRFYFVHSFFVECHQSEDIHATSFYGKDFVAAFSRNNINGVQFHPEKSHRFGIALFKNFIKNNA